MSGKSSSQISTEGPFAETYMKTINSFDITSTTIFLPTIVTNPRLVYNIIVKEIYTIF